MKIERNKKEVPFDEIAVGETFECEKGIFLKIEPVYDKGFDDNFTGRNAVDLVEGISWYFDDFFYVTPIAGKFVIE